jgi:hypothetical protein
MFELVAQFKDKSNHNETYAKAVNANIEKLDNSIPRVVLLKIITKRGKKWQ